MTVTWQVTVTFPIILIDIVKRICYFLAFQIILSDKVLRQAQFIENYVNYYYFVRLKFLNVIPTEKKVVDFEI